jgi:hypothetical protein
MEKIITGIVESRQRALELPAEQRWLLHLVSWSSLTLLGTLGMAAVLHAATS